MSVERADDINALLSVLNFFYSDLRFVVHVSVQDYWLEAVILLELLGVLTCPWELATIRGGDINHRLRQVSSSEVIKMRMLLESTYLLFASATLSALLLAWKSEAWSIQMRAGSVKAEKANFLVYINNQ
jgi:hypothetical protein